MAGVMPLSSLRDVVGPIARCVRDAALTLDVLAGYSVTDPNTAACRGKIPQGGYASQLQPQALRGQRIGTYGPGWRDLPLSAATATLYARALAELESQGAILIEDPFRGTGFAAIEQSTPPLHHCDARGIESLPYDLEHYLQHLGPQAALRSFAELLAKPARAEVFGREGLLHYLHSLPGYAACLAAPQRAPEQSAFLAARRAYLDCVDAVFERHRLQALVLPQMSAELPLLRSGIAISATSVDQINIAGLPAVTVPAGYHESGAPFGLILIGPLWSEARLIALAYAYECATRHRRAPSLESSTDTR